jgi:glycosyltransferase involved in cell wall biosynthesis
MTRPPLVIIHPHFTLPGGAGKLVLEIGKRLAKERTVIVIAQTIWPKYREQYPEIDFISLRGPITSSLKYWLIWPWWVLRTHRILRALEQQHGQLIILNNVFPAHWTGLLYTKFNKTSRALWFCQEPSAFIHIERWRRSIINPVSRLIANVFQPFFAMFDRWLVNAAELIFANSQFGASMVQNIYDRQATVIYPGTNLIDKPIPWTDHKKTVLAVGRFTKFKHFDLIIKSFCQANLPDYSLILVGDGEERAALELLIKNLDADQKITIASGLSDQELTELYLHSRILIMASKQEPFGMVAIEAMASGMVVVAHRSGGPMEIVVDGVTGKLVESHTVEAFSDALCNLVINEDQLQIMSKAARDRVRDHFTWKIASERIDSLI